MIDAGREGAGDNTRCLLLVVDTCGHHSLQDFDVPAAAAAAVTTAERATACDEQHERGNDDEEVSPGNRALG